MSIANRINITCEEFKSTMNPHVQPCRSCYYKITPIKCSICNQFTCLCCGSDCTRCRQNRVCDHCCNHDDKSRICTSCRGGAVPHTPLFLVANKMQID